MSRTDRAYLDVKGSQNLQFFHRIYSLARKQFIILSSGDQLELMGSFREREVSSPHVLDERRGYSISLAWVCDGGKEETESKS